MARRWGVGVLEGVGDTVGVGVDLLGLADEPVVAVAQAQDDGGQQGSQQGAGEDADLDVLVLCRAQAEGELPMSRETVNPMPASSDRPTTSHQATSSASRARVNRVISQVAPVMPTVLPTTRPAMMPTAMLSVSEAPSPDRPPTVTPAEREANTGTANPAEMGRKRYSKCSASPGPASGPPAAWLRTTGTVKANRTPATVAWIPDSCTSTQVRTASGSSNHQERTRFCTSNQKTANGINASVRASGLHPRLCGRHECLQLGEQARQ